MIVTVDGTITKTQYDRITRSLDNFWRTYVHINENKVREKLMDYFSSQFSGRLTRDDTIEIENRTDHLLGWLWMQGYHVVARPIIEGEEEDTLPDVATTNIVPFKLFKRR